MKHCKRLLSALAAAALLFLCGCGGEGIEQYFSLPQPADDYMQLQELIDNEIARGCEYASPTGGSYRQPIQLLDLDNDKVNEAVAFLRAPGGNVKINFYKVYRDGYRLVLSLNGDGTAVGGVDYADLNGDGTTDMAVSWRIGTGLRLLTVYDLGGWGGEVLLTTGCSEFIVTELDGDGREDLVVISETAAGGGTAELYSFPANGEPHSRSAKLSAEATELERIRPCTLEGNVPALLVESTCGDGALVSDLFAAMEGSFFNITLGRGQTTSNTRRSYAVFASDIDNDHFIEIPSPTSLYSSGSAETFWAITWHSYNRYGQPTVKLRTYHCYSDGWFFELPDSWFDTLTVRRDDTVAGERSVILSQVDPETGAVTDNLILYTLTGENRGDRSRLAGRFVVYEADATIYAAQIINGLSEEAAKAAFHLIYTEWSTGTV